MQLALHPHDDPGPRIAPDDDASAAESSSPEDDLRYDINKSMDQYYMANGHQRSLSSIASSIIPLASDASTMTSVTASPVEPHAAKQIPLELTVPLPDSSSSSDTADGPKDEFNNARKDLPKIVLSTKSLDGHAAADGKSDPLPYDDQTGSERLEEEGPVSIAELQNLAREELTQAQHAASVSSALEKDLLTNGLQRRLSSTLGIAYGNLIDQFKGDDQEGFRGLYDACERLSSSCLDPQLPLPEQADLARDDVEENQSTLERISGDDQDSILLYINKLRTDLDYLADLICALPSTELVSLTSSYHPAGVEYSVLPNHSHGRTQAYSRDSQMFKLSRRIDNVQTFHQRDPYFALLYSLFDSSAAPGSQEYNLKLEVWARTCARVMSEGKVGSEEFAIATIDSFVDTDQWSMKPRLEAFLLQLLAEGSFLLDPPSGASGGPESDMAVHAVAVADFFDRQTRRLLRILSAGSATAAVPSTVLNLIHRTLERIQDPQMRDLAKKFIVSRWYFAIFLSSLIVFPEVRGLLLTHHIGYDARQHILKELVLRLQSQMFSILTPSASAAFIPSEVSDSLQRIFNFFEAPPSPPSASPGRVGHSQQTLMLSHWDIHAIVETLHPYAGNTLTASDSHTLYPPAGHALALSEPSTQPSTSASSSVTLRIPSSDTGDTHAPSEDSFAHSASTESTMVEGTQQDTQSQPRFSIGPEFSRRLHEASAALKEAARKSMASQTSLHADWILLELLPNSTVRAKTSALLVDAALPNTSMDSEDEYEVLKKNIATLLSGANHEGLLYDANDASSDPIKCFLEGMKESAMLQQDFTGSYQLQKLLETYERRATSDDFYRIISRDMAATLRERVQHWNRSRDQVSSCIASFGARIQVGKAILTSLANSRKALRNKMWYISDVKLSSSYEDAARVMKALRAMANPKREKQASGFASWARQRFRGASSYARADRQVLDAMIAPAQYGGLSKLADDQIDLTIKWMTRNSVENFCRGEERIHRFCFEVQKLVTKLAGVNFLDNAVLWSSKLYQRERVAFDSPLPATGIYGSPITPVSRHGDVRGPSSLGSPGFFSEFQDARLRKSWDLSTGLQIAHVPAYGYAGPASDERRFSSPPSISIGQIPGHPTPPLTPLSPRHYESFQSRPAVRSEAVSKPKSSFVEEIKQQLRALVISDLSYYLWTDGSDTDRWMRDALVDECSVQETRAPGSTDATGFQYEDAYRTLLQKLSLLQDPYRKIDVLVQLEDIVIKQISGSRHAPASLSERGHTAGTITRDVPRTKATSIEEVIANCTERRAGTLHKTTRRGMPASSTTTTAPSREYAEIASTDRVVSKLISIFRDPWLRPATLYRDLQIIAAFVPSDILDQTATGKAFWDAGLAALALKEDIINDSMQRAGRITEYHINNRVPGDPSASSSPQPLREHHDDSSTPAWLVKSTLKDAPALYLPAAKEGIPLAARELALFYLTHPDSMPRATAPFAKAKNVFMKAPATLAASSARQPRRDDKQAFWHNPAPAPVHTPTPIPTLQAPKSATDQPDAVPSSSSAIKPEASEAKKAVQAPSTGANAPAPSPSPALDPLTFAVVLHWMDVAATGGDREAEGFLRGNGVV